MKFAGLGDNYSSDRDTSQVENMPSAVMGQLRQMSPEQLAQSNIDINNPQQIEQVINQQVSSMEEQFSAFKSLRKDIFHSSMNRSILFLLLGVGVMALFFYTEVKSEYILAGLAVLVLMDLIPVNLNYLSKREDNKGKFVHWIPSEEKEFPVAPTAADMRILEIESRNPGNPEGDRRRRKSRNRKSK